MSTWTLSEQPPHDHVHVASMHGRPTQPLSSMIGRDEDLAHLMAVLVDSKTRIVTIVGPGGIGKTRLARQAAHDAQFRFLNGAAVVQLATISSADQFLQAVIQSLGMPTGKGLPPIEMIGRFLRDKQALLLFDNFEHVLDAADHVTDLLRLSPGLSVLCTSRSRLRVQGEKVIPLASLDTDDAAELFINRARSTMPSFAANSTTARAITALCEQLDGLPLAIELAAARVPILPPQMLLERSHRRLDLLTGGARDAAPRHHSLSRTISWSYDLLQPADQALLRRLSVFAGGFTLSAAEAVCGFAPLTGVGGKAIEASITRLRETSLIRHRPVGSRAPRDFLLHVIREFAHQKLVAANEESETRERHAMWCMDFVDKYEVEQVSPDSGMPSHPITLERPNLREGIGWLERQQRYADALKMVAGMWPIWLERGAISEGRALLDQLLDHASDVKEQSVLAKAMGVAGALAQAMGDNERAVSLSHRALSVHVPSGHTRDAAVAHVTLGLAAMVTGEPESARHHLEASRAGFHDVKDLREGSWSLRHLASLAFQAGDLDRSAALAEQGLAILHNRGAPLQVAHLQAQMALAVAGTGDLDRAKTMCEEALDIYRSEGNRWGEADVLERLGHLAIEHGDFNAARVLLEDSVRLFEDVGDPEGTVFAMNRLGWLDFEIGDVESASGQFERALEGAQYRKSHLGVQGSLMGLGALAIRRGNTADAVTYLSGALKHASPAFDKLSLVSIVEWICQIPVVTLGEVTARMLGACSAMRLQLDAPLPPTRVNPVSSRITVINAQIGRTAFNAAWKSGLRMTETDLIEEALGYLRRVSPADTTRQDDSLLTTLTSREREVLAYLVEGWSNRSISEALYISERTVEAHVMHILTKLDATSRTEAAAHAIRAGLS